MSQRFWIVLGAAAGLLVRFLFSRMGRRLLIPVALVLAVGWFVFPDQTRGFLSSLFGGGAQTRELSPEERARIESEQAVYEVFVSKMLATTEDVWGALLPQTLGVRYSEPQLQLFSGATESRCRS